MLKFECVPKCVSALSVICIHEFTIVYSAAWRTYKQAGHHVLCVCLPQRVCVSVCVGVFVLLGEYNTD